jgi:hypothetical protein
VRLSIRTPLRVGSAAQRALQHFGMAAQLETRRSDPAGFLIGEYQAAAAGQSNSRKSAKRFSVRNCVKTKG